VEFILLLRLLEVGSGRVGFERGRCARCDGFPRRARKMEFEKRYLVPKGETWRNQSNASHVPHGRAIIPSIHVPVGERIGYINLEDVMGAGNCYYTAAAAAAAAGLLESFIARNRL
jgi:hypothetical protein